MTHIASSVSVRAFARRFALAPSIVVVTLWACDPKASRANRAPAGAGATPRASTSAPLAPSAARHGDTKVEPTPPKSRPAEPSSAEDKADDLPVVSSRYFVDGLNDVGPAAPASAFEGGVVMVTRNDELSISKLLAPPSKAKKPASGEIEASTRGPQEFWPVARGPAISRTHAYWISKGGRLVRRPLAGGELELLATDARDGTRVAVVSSPDVVAYIAAPVGKQDSRALLRLPDGKMLVLTPEGAAASSVSLSRVGEDVVVGYIDGRSGMTPVHARKLRKNGELTQDVVVWVSGATQGMTEIVSVGSPSGSWLMLPVERDSSRFGLATLALALEPKMDPPLRWRTYPNGLDRSPAAAAALCGAPTVAYVRPADARPGASQELVISELTLDETASSEQLATARGFADVSLYPLPEGAMLVYVADRRTWARLIRCK
jgi:hypothetical protein